MSILKLVNQMKEIRREKKEWFKFDTSQPFVEHVLSLNQLNEEITSNIFKIAEDRFFIQDKIIPVMKKNYGRFIELKVTEEDTIEVMYRKKFYLRAKEDNVEEENEDIVNG